MSLLGRIGGVLRDKLNTVIDGAQDPAAKVEALLAECREHMKSATTELIAYKATEKRLAQASSELAAQALTWRQRAEIAVLGGDDPLAREALGEEQRVSAEHRRVEGERREMAGYAAELLRGRRALEQRIRELDMKKGTIAQQLSAQPGGSSVLAAEGRAWDALDRAAARIDDDAALAEVDAMLGDPLAAADEVVEAKLRETMKRAVADQALAELKAKMGKPPGKP